MMLTYFISPQHLPWVQHSFAGVLFIKVSKARLTEEVKRVCACQVGAPSPRCCPVNLTASPISPFIFHLWPQFKHNSNVKQPALWKKLHLSVTST